jgi:hypothetical protein
MLFSLSFFVLSISTLATALPNLGERALHRSPVTLEDRTLGPLNTNAKRLAAGLPPLPAARAWTPTGTDGAKRSTPSSATYTGAIKVIRAEDNGDFGYISKTLDPNGRYIVDIRDNAASVSFLAYQSGLSATISITDLSAITDDRKFTTSIGAAIVPGSELAADSSNAAVLGGSMLTLGGAISQATTYTTILGSAVQSAIWSFDPSNNQLTASWVNSNSQTLAVTLFWNPTGTALVLTADANKYVQENPTAFAIKLALTS